MLKSPLLGMAWCSNIEELSLGLLLAFIPRFSVVYL